MTDAVRSTPYHRRMRYGSVAWCATVLLLAASTLGQKDRPGAAETSPFEQQVKSRLAQLHSESATEREQAAEDLGFLRAYRAEGALIGCLDDRSVAVRRQAAMALAWCGGRGAVRPLLAALEDEDWATRQAAHVSLTNLTGRELPFDALAPPAERQLHAGAWQDWWSGVPDGAVPAEVVDLLTGLKELSSRRVVTASSTYKGPPAVLGDRRIGPEFWQTKNVPFPQWCTLDLGQPETIARVTVHQYGPRFVMTEYELATSVDGESFERVVHERTVTPVELQIDFPARRARYVRITSFGSVQPTYPTTFFEIEVGREGQAPDDGTDDDLWRYERGLRAIGALGGKSATALVLDHLGHEPFTDERHRPLVQAGIRALGRLREAAGYEALIALLESTELARCAADALGDFGDARAVPHLVTAYAKYAKRLDGADPLELPPDDRMGFPSEDRMLETPYWIAHALARLPLGAPEDHAAIAGIAPLLMANLPGDHDTFFLYEPEVADVLTRYLLTVSGQRQEACEQAFVALGARRRVPESTPRRPWPTFNAPGMSTWLSTLCAEAEDLPRLGALLQHEDGWVRMNAAKALAWLGDRRAIPPLAQALRETPAEVAFGYSATFKHEEYADPAPRWREALVRALGLLGAHEETARIVDVLEDEGSVLEVRHAAALALADLGSDEALSALERAAEAHPFHSVRLAAEEALRHAGRGVREVRPESGPARPASSPPIDDPAREPEAIVFIQGDNDIPNTRGTVEQADRWRQTYVVTDSGPAYRPGRNLFLLAPPRPDGEVTPLTHFADGWVADPELSFDGTEVIFTHRGEEDPWWHVWRIRLDGSGLEQVTRGPYHDVGPAFLPDGRIVFSSSRGGVRDEYHGYPCTSLHVMNADGTDLHPIAVNIGRDNEPAVLPDGRIVFSRLEVFYSRNKTELTLHAVRPDGTGDVVLYGPERREFWRDLDTGLRSPAHAQEAPLTHRVLRMTQPQPMPDGRGIVVVTQGGLVLVGPRRDTETFLTSDNEERAYTTPFPLPDGRILCASTRKVAERGEVDLGLYFLDPATGELELLYNDPELADFEARPLLTRRRPPVLSAAAQRRGFSGHFLCNSVFRTQEPEVAARGRLVRLIEGTPVPGRHSTQTNRYEVWQNHGGTLARVLGTAPLAADGSFFVNVPADRLLHFQVLDSDRRVLGNQLTWIYPRPGETRSCIGCHQDPHVTTTGGAPPLAQGEAPLDFTPTGEEFRYRAKAWFKGTLPAPIEERTRTVRAVNLLAR